MYEFDGILAFDKLEGAVEEIRQRLLRATSVLESAGVPYAVVGGNAVMAWVEQVDRDAVRFTRDVQLAIRRADLDRAISAMEEAGFVYRHSAGMDMFLDGPDGKARSAVHVIFSGEKVRPTDLATIPDVSQYTSFTSYRVISLEGLVQMKLISYRDKDRTHLRDMIGVGLIDETWPAKFPGELGARLQQLLDDPDG
jgi:hypothetical protein